MAAIGPQQLYEEFKNDPAGIGYAIGNGVPFNTKESMINEDRPAIQVQRVFEGKETGPGKVSETISVQPMRDSIDPDEYKSNCDPIAGDTEVAIGVKASTRDRIALLLGGSDGQSQLAFTQLLKTQILDLFPNNDWPTTRANLIDLQTRDGSRAEQLFGSPDAPVSRNDMLAAQQWGQDNGQPSLYE